MKFKKDEGKTYNLSNLPSKPIEVQDLMPPIMPQKTWQPNGQTFTMPYGGQVPKMVDVQALNNPNDTTKA